MNIKISVIIPVYNVKEYLNKCIDSVIRQTMKELEIICIDDGSTDGSGRILDDYAALDQRIQVIHKTNTGYGNSMNIGLENAHAKYIGIVESDDFIDPNMFESLFEIAERTDAEVVRSQFYDYRSREGDVYRDLFSGIPSDEIIKPSYGDVVSPRDNKDIFHSYVYLWSSLYRRDFLIENDVRFNETPGASFQDIGFTYKVLSSVQRLLYTERAWYHYRRDNENASANSKGKIYCVCDEFAEIWRYLRKYPKKLDAVRYFIPPAQFRRYGETKGRISEEHYWEFEERMLYDLDQLAEEGYIEESYWSKDAWSDYQQQIKAYDDHSAILQYWRMVHGYIGNSIVVFGAGKVALRVIERLRQEGIAIEAVIVSDPGMNPSEIAGIQVFSLMDYSEKNKTVLVCLKAENLYIVLRRLRQAGYTNVLVADVLFREILGKNVKKLY